MENRQPPVRTPSAEDFALTLSAWEGRWVGFKEAVSDSLPREFVAFANSGGGRIYIGVADDKSVKGTTVTSRLLSRGQDMARGCDPPVALTAIPFRHGGKDLVMIDVPEGSRKPYGCSAGYFLRVGPNSQKLRRDELVEFDTFFIATFRKKEARKIAAGTDRTAPQVESLLRAAARRPLSRRSLQSAAGIKDRKHFRKAYLDRFLEAGWLKRTIPDKPNSRLQKYATIPVGRKALT